MKAYGKSDPKSDYIAFLKQIASLFTLAQFKLIKEPKTSLNCTSVDLKLVSMVQQAGYMFGLAGYVVVKPNRGYSSGPSP